MHAMRDRPSRLRDRPLLAAVVFVSATALGTASPALACQCPNGPDGVVRWPADGARDVAADTPIVVQLTDHRGDPGKIGISLKDDADHEIALDEVERVPPSWKGCGAAEAVFLRPARRLDPGAKYSVWFNAGSTLQRGATFTASDHSFEPEPAIAAVVTYAAHYPTRACLDADCPAFANIQVELDAPPERLAWLFIESSADVSARQHWPLWPGRSDRMFSLTVMQGADDRCVDVRIVGLEGRALFAQRVCQPSSCAVCTIIAGSTCGAPSSCGSMMACDEPVDAGVAPAMSGDDAGARHIESASDDADGGVPHDAQPRARVSHRRNTGCSAVPSQQRDVYGLAALALPLMAAAHSVRLLRRRRGG
jgi:hypothetical protein